MRLQLFLKNRIVYTSGIVAKPLIVDPWDETAFGGHGRELIHVSIDYLTGGQAVKFDATFNELAHLRDVLNRVIVEKGPGHDL